MFDWLSDAVGGLASLFGSGGGGVSDASAFFSDPTFSLGGTPVTDAFGNTIAGATTDINGDLLNAGSNSTGFTLGESMIGPNGEPLRPGAFDMTLGGAQPMGFVDASGNLVDVNGAPVRPTSFGGFSSNLGGGPAGLQDAINGIRPSMGGGGSSTNVSLPKLDVPTSGIVPTTPTPGMAPSPVPQTAPNGQQSGFTPMTANVATAQAPQDAQGLRRLFAEALRGAA